MNKLIWKWGTGKKVWVLELRCQSSFNLGISIWRHFLFIGLTFISIELRKTYNV